MSPVQIPDAQTEAAQEPPLTEPLAQRFHRGAATGMAIHPVLALILAVFVGDALPLDRRLATVGLVCAGALTRFLIHRAAARRQDDPAALLVWTRHSTSVMAATWGLVAFMVIPAAPPGVDGRFLMLVAGLVAGSLITHEADPPGFQRFTALLLGPTLVALVLERNSLLALDVLLITAFWGTIFLLHKRTHQELRQGLAANLQLQGAIGRATREQDFVNAIFAGAPYGMAVFDPDDYLARSSLEFQRIVGPEADEQAASDPDSLRLDPFWSVLRTVTDRARIQGRAAQEVHLPSPDQGGACYEIAAAAGRGAATGWVVVLIEDLTPIREAEAARREAEASYEDLVQTAHDLIWKTDIEGRWTFLNAAAGEIYQESPVDLLGSPAFDRNHPDRWKSDVAAFEQVLRGEDLVNHETVIVTHTGEERVLSFSARAMRDDAGNVVGAQGVARDVTVRKRAEEQARRMAQEAARATQMKSAFLANMSHEIRTPMNGVLGMTELLLGTELDAEQRQFLEVIQSSGETLLRLLNDILDISKIEAGHLELETIPFDLQRTLSDSVQVLGTVADKRGNRLTLEWDDALPAWISGDPGRLRQVLTNLVSNAVKFTQDGAVTVRAQALDAGERLRVEVEDTGVGIAPDKLEAVFQEFSQADTSVTRKFGGTGLGLTICRRLVELMGGFIDVRSQLDVGSTFFFEIPLAEAEAPAEDPGEPTSPRAPVAPHTPDPSPVALPVETPTGSSAPSGDASDDNDAPPILVAEDTPVNQQVALSMLRRAGYRVELVENGLDAVAAVQEGGYALVLMDIQMPVMDGLEATRTIREWEAGSPRRTPIVALTAHALEEERNRCLQAGMDDFLSKPFKPADLLDTVERWYAEPGVDGPESTSADSKAAPGPPVPTSDASAVDDDTPPVDLDGFRASMREAGIEEVVDTMLELFLEELPKRLDDIRQAHGTGDLEALASAAHALKSAAGNVRAQGLYEWLRTLERSAREGDAQAADHAVAQVVDHAQQAESYLGALR